jgi:hypothetical protein
VLTLSLRGEYIHSDQGGSGTDGAPIFGSGGYTQDDGSFRAGAENDWSETVTLAFNVWDNLLTRVEYRFDDLHGGISGTAGHADIQHEISLNAVYSF